MVDMQQPRIIGLSGLARSGKDTLGQALAKDGYRKLAFADPLKDLALVLNPIISQGGLRLVDAVGSRGWEHTKTAYPESRRILQFLGTEVVRTIQPDYWVDQVRTRVSTSQGRFVVTDVRFESEAAMIRECGGIVVEVIRPGLTPDGHISEGNVRADWAVVNDGTPDALYRGFIRELARL